MLSSSGVFLRLLEIGSVALAVCTLATTSLAQQRAFPERGVRVIVPYAPSGAVDITARILAKELAELVAAAQAKPGMINYATNGINGTHHLTWERLQRAANVKLNHIPYKGAATALQDVLAGHVPMMLAAVATAFPYIKDGRIVPVATGGPTRAPLLPELPTLIESGYPGFEVISWMGVLSAKGTPPALIERISRDLNKVTQSDVYQSGLAQRGTEARTSTPQLLAERIRDELKRNEALVKSLGIKAN